MACRRRLRTRCVANVRCQQPQQLLPAAPLPAEPGTAELAVRAVHALESHPMFRCPSLPVRGHGRSIRGFLRPAPARHLHRWLARCGPGSPALGLSLLPQSHFLLPWELNPCGARSRGAPIRCPPGDLSGVVGRTGVVVSEPRFVTLGPELSVIAGEKGEKAWF